MKYEMTTVQQFCAGFDIISQYGCNERTSLPSKNFPYISMDMLQIGALVLLGRLVEPRALLTNTWLTVGSPFQSCMSGLT